MIGKPNPLRGVFFKAIAILADGYAGSDAMTEEIREFVKGITAPYKRVLEIKYRTSLPKTISDKIRRVELREEL